MLVSFLCTKLKLPWAILLAGLFLSGCSVFIDAHQTTFDPKGPIARDQLTLFYITLGVVTFIFVVVASILLYAVVRYRAKPGSGQETLPEQTHGNPLLEAGVVAASIALLVVIAVPTVRSAIYIYTVPEDGEILEVTATGYQWWWTFEYPELGVMTANEMWIPKETNIRINLRTQDVIHSFWVPKLAGKVDMIPNRNNWMWLRADEEGMFHGQCAEFCGESHANMLFRVISVGRDEFDAWVARQRQPGRDPATADDPLALAGRELFQTKGCVQCHHVEGLGLDGGILGPDLTHFGERHTVAAGLLANTPENLAAWIRDPERIKPGNLMTAGVVNQNLTEPEIERLVAYLKSLNLN